MKYEVYLHTNTINNKIYIGITSRSMDERWNNHVKKSFYENRKNLNTSYFHQSIVKYSADVWSHQLLEIIDGTLQDAKDTETKWIAFYKSNEKNIGYNLTKGGDVSDNMSEEVRQKISEKISILMQDPIRRETQSKKMKEHWKNNPNPFAGKTHSEESKTIMGAKSKTYQEEHGNPFAGKTHDEETRKRMSEAAKERCKDPNWQAPLQKEVRDETREKMAAAKRGKHSGKISKDDILRVSKECKTKKEIAEKLGCTPANITHLVKSFDIKNQVGKLLGK